jgi:HPt (histidine-containing phosphotransfer) domain-containing protein
MTAHALVEERQRCLDAGMNDHVSKPIDSDALFVTLLRWAKPRQVQAPGAEDRAAKLVNEMILPEIDGVDMTGGLKRVAGNKRLYRDLLIQFAAKQAEVDSQILAAIESGDKKLAERVAHTVKGVAGNIGLGSVFTAVEKLERAIGESDATVPTLVEEFTHVMACQAQAIQNAMQNVILDRPAESQTIAKFDPRAASAAVTRLRALLESSDADAEEAFHTLEDALGAICDKSRLSAFGAAISEFDFDTARMKLDEITKEYSANWEQIK